VWAAFAGNWLGGSTSGGGGRRRMLGTRKEVMMQKVRHT
jgi:hypothetical protein